MSESSSDALSASAAARAEGGLPEVNLGAVAPGQPHARAPVDIESSLSEPQQPAYAQAQEQERVGAAGSVRSAQSRGAGGWNGAERRLGAPMAALVQLADMLPALRLLVGMMIASLVIAALYFGRAMLIPLAMAFLLGFLLDPAVSRLKRWGLPRLPAAVLVVGLALGAVGGLGMYLGSQVQQLSADLPTYQNTIRDKLRSLRQQAHMPSAWDGVFATYYTVEKEIGSSDTPAERVQKVQIEAPESRPSTQLVQWLGRIGQPVAMAGIVLLFVILILLDRDDLRDRLLRLMGGNLHIATDALFEASERIGKYLRMQFVVNVSYGVPLALGLWLIGVPGAILWGVLGAIMRFVPYVGALLSALLPLALAFAVDPGWNMLMLTLGLILVLELISNNVIEPWLYGSSTGLSTLSIIVAATFWTALWGPIGLILSTPLTVCLLVLGRNIPALKFMEVLLGSEPVLGPQQRLYQRLLADDSDEAVSAALEMVEHSLPAKPTAQDKADAVRRFYDEVAIPALRIATQQHLESATAEHRLRLSSGMDALLEEFQEHYAAESWPAPENGADQRKPLCIHSVGARWEVDALGAVMVAHAQSLYGHRVTHSDWALSMQAGLSARSHSTASGLDEEQAWFQAMEQADLLVLSIFNSQPQNTARRLVRRIRKRWPKLPVVLALFNAPGVAADPELAAEYGAQACVTSLHELHLWVQAMQAQELGEGGVSAPVPEDDALRVQALHASGVLQPQLLPLYRDTVQKAANAFHVRWAQVSWVDSTRIYAPGSLLIPPAAEGKPASLPREHSICSYVVYEEELMVIGDLARDPRFNNNAKLQQKQIRFYAGAPLTDRKGHVLGCFAIMDESPRNLSNAEIDLLIQMADQLMADIRVELK